MVSRLLRTVMIVAALFAVGCVQNAILELQIELPALPAGDDPWFVQVQIRKTTGNSFMFGWMGGAVPTTIALGSERQWDCISVISDDEAVDLHVRVRFCRSSDCVDDFRDSNAPERLYALEHPFYIGRRTYYRIEVPTIPTCVVDDDCLAENLGACVANKCVCATTADCAVGFRCEPEVGCVEEVGRCSIEGCIDGVSAEFCSMETGLHFCERNDNIARDDTYMCEVPPE